LTLALYFLIFSTGRPGYSVPLGLLVAGLSIPAGFMRLLPRWLVVAGFKLPASRLHHKEVQAEG
jgi:hypothetical protein